MASVGYLKSLFGTLPADTRKVFDQMAEYLLANWQFGPVEHQRRATNHQSYFLMSTTAESTGEFSIEHGLGRAPYTLLPVLDLTAVGARMVPLEVTRAADASRVYLKSTSTNAPFAVLVE